MWTGYARHERSLGTDGRNCRRRSPPEYRLNHSISCSPRRYAKRKSSLGSPCCRTAAAVCSYPGSAGDVPRGFCRTSSAVRRRDGRNLCRSLCSPSAIRSPDDFRDRTGAPSNHCHSQRRRFRRRRRAGRQYLGAIANYSLSIPELPVIGAVGEVEIDAEAAAAGGRLLDQLPFLCRVVFVKFRPGRRGAEPA
jgi:hypothetical protein